MAKGTCKMCGSGAVEVCREHFCQSCHRGKVSWEDCIQGVWAARWPDPPAHETAER